MDAHMRKGAAMVSVQSAVILFFLLVVSAFGSIGSIVAVKGDVSVERGKQVLKATTGMKVEEKDTIVSKTASKVQVLFNDKTVITIGKDSSFKIAEYLFEAGQEKADFNFAKGAFRTITGQIGKAAPEKFTLRTKTATIGIRGTQILGDVGQTPEDPVKVAFTEGHGFVQTPQGQVDIQAGQITQVSPGKPPTPPRAYKPAEIKQMGQSSGGGGEKMKTDDVIGTNGEAKADEEPQSEAGTGDEAPQADTGDEVEAEVDQGIDAAVEEVGLSGVDTEILGEFVDELSENIVEQSDIKDADEVITETEDVIQEVIDATGLDLSPNVAEFVDHLNDKIIAFDENDPYLSWGLWVKSSADTANLLPSDIIEGWVAGDMTPESKVSEYILNQQSATYSGGVKGIVDEAGSSTFMSNGSVNLNIDFGSSSNPVSGNIQFDAGSDHWNLGVGSSSVQSNGFMLNSFTTGSGSDVSIGSGSGVGSFYGPNLESVGGKFSAGNGATVDESSKAAYGVFTGSR